MESPNPARRWQGDDISNMFVVADAEFEHAGPASTERESRRSRRTRGNIEAEAK